MHRHTFIQAAARQFVFVFVGPLRFVGVFLPSALKNLRILRDADACHACRCYTVDFPVPLLHVVLYARRVICYDALEDIYFEHDYFA